jgi:hypothetical protein
MPSKAEERWKRLAAMGAKGAIPTESMEMLGVRPRSASLQL